MKALSINEILEENPFTSNYQGSEKTKELVAEQIRKIWGDQEVKNYNPSSKKNIVRKIIKLRKLLHLKAVWNKTIKYSSI